ncbi:hypothetical protein ACN47E_006776 [Coniothyrium glycines]
MLLTILTSLVLPAVVLTAPSSLARRAAEDNCAPIAYTLSDYILTTSAVSARVDFTVKSSFVDTTGIVDAVIHGVDCGADGPTIPNNNVCRTADRKLLFDLRGPQSQAYYQLTHTWTCNGYTWMSGTPVQIDPLDCTDDGTKRICRGGPQTIKPQNVRKICNSPTHC